MSLKKLVHLATFGVCVLLSTSGFGQTSNRVPMVQTPLTEAELLHVLHDSYKETFGTEPSDKKLAMAWAQVAFENGRGKAVFNRNIGNTVPTLPTHQFYCVTVAGSKQCYRSFSTLIESGKLYWATVKNCSAAFASFEAGNAYAAAIYLKNCHYYDGDAKAYGAAMASLFTDAMKLIPGEKLVRQQREEIQRLADTTVGFPTCNH